MTDGPSPRQQVLGSIMAGAVGDALGAPIEFLSIEDIRARFGPAGTTDYADAYGGRGKITDDTQLTLFTMEGLIRSHVALRRQIRKRDPLEAVQHAYQRWYHTQGVPWHEAGGDYALDEAPDGWLITNRELFSRRAPGSTVMAALRSYAKGGQRGSLSHALNDSKGCGAVMRAAPVALWADDAEEVFVFGAATGSLTHGHASGILSAGALAQLVHLLLGGADLPTALDETRAQLSNWEDHGEQVRALEAACAVAARGRPSPETIAERLGGGWVGEEALAIGVCAALVAEDLEDGLLLAVNHSGDSDSTGSVCGNILGAIHGVDAIPARWLAELELREVIEQLTLDALAEFGDEPPSSLEWMARYPAW